MTNTLTHTRWKVAVAAVGMLGVFAAATAAVPSASDKKDEITFDMIANKNPAIL